MPKEQKVQSEEPMKTNWADDSPTSIGLVLGDVWVRWGFKKDVINHVVTRYY